LLGVIAGALGFIAWNVLGEGEVRRPATGGVMPLAQPGIRQPATFPPDSARLPDDAPVVGVSAGGKTRAYLVAAFSPLPGGQFSPHVVNDLLGDTPVTVTHCDRTGCTRVFTDADARQPPEIDVGGWFGGEGGSLLLLVGGVRYRQDTTQPLTGIARFPYADAHFERTTWKRWRNAHPDTDVYLGPALHPGHGSTGPGARVTLSRRGVTYRHTTQCLAPLRPIIVLPDVEPCPTPPTSGSSPTDPAARAAEKCSRIPPRRPLH
jgi:hypothetical protein